MVNRRRFLGQVALSLLTAPLAAEAQQTGKMPSIGILFQSSPLSDMIGTEPRHPYLGGFMRGLRELGWVEDRNIVIHRRTAAGNLARLPDLARQLVHLHVRVIVVTTTSTLKAARGATDTIPIVWATGRDPVGRGFAKNLARPGGNVTGLTMDTGLELRVKRLELLREISPDARRVATLILRRRTSQERKLWLTQMQSQAELLDLTIIPAEVEDSPSYGPVFAKILEARTDALLVHEASPNLTHLTQIIEFAAKHRLPAMYAFSGAAKRGGLMEYATDLYSIFHRAAGYVDKILRGATAGELPFERPTKFSLVINLKTAAALGLTIPQSLLRRADRVIE